jgi:hypothetical protein
MRVIISVIGVLDTSGVVPKIRVEPLEDDT